MATGRAGVVVAVCVVAAVCAVVVLTQQQPPPAAQSSLVQLLPQSQISTAIHLFSSAGKTDT